MKKEKFVFAQFNELKDLCIKEGCISNELIELHKKVMDRFAYFKDQSMKERNVINGLKLFSAAKTCESILSNTYKQLENAREKGENPKTLEELRDIFTVIVDLGEKLESTFSGEGECPDIHTIRNITFGLQEESEKRGLLEPIEDRIKKVPLEIRKDFVEKLLIV